MRYERGKPPGSTIHMVWHCEEVRKLDDVIWADDETMEYRQYDSKSVYGLPGSSSIKQAKLIVVINRIIFIHPPVDRDERLSELVFEEVVA